MCLKDVVLGWRNGLLVKTIYCSAKGAEFSSLSLYQVAHYCL